MGDHVAQVHSEQHWRSPRKETPQPVGATSVIHIHCQYGVTFSRRSKTRVGKMAIETPDILGICW